MDESQPSEFVAERESLPALLQRHEGKTLEFKRDLSSPVNGLSTRQVAEVAALSPRSARTRLKALIEKGPIVEVGSSPTDPRRVYLPAEKTGRPGDTAQG